MFRFWNAYWSLGAHVAPNSLAEVKDKKNICVASMIVSFNGKRGRACCALGVTVAGLVGQKHHGPWQAARK